MLFLPEHPKSREGLPGTPGMVALEFSSPLQPKFPDPTKPQADIPKLPNPHSPGAGVPRELIQLFAGVSTVFLWEIRLLEFTRPCPCSHKKSGAGGNYGIKSSLPLILTLQPQESQRVLLFSLPTFPNLWLIPSFPIKPTGGSCSLSRQPP